MKCRSLLAAAALVPLALGDYSYDYSVPTMAPTTETALPTLEVCPVLVGLDASECPLGFLNETYPACNSTGLVLGERCWAIVPDDPDQPPTCGDEPQTDCAYTGPPFDTTARRRESNISISLKAGFRRHRGRADAHKTIPARRRRRRALPTRVRTISRGGPSTARS